MVVCVLRLSGRSGIARPGGKGGRGSWEWTCSLLYGQFKLSMLTGAWSQLDGLTTSGNGSEEQDGAEAGTIGSQEKN